MIHFVTPLYRYSNIPIIYSTLIHQVAEFQWHLIEGSNKVQDTDLTTVLQDERVHYVKIKTHYPWGHEQRNYFLTDIQAPDNDWCYFLDDDNVVTSDLVEIAAEYLDRDVDIILLSQKAGLTEKTRLYGFEGRLRLGLCDIGSFLVRIYQARCCDLKIEWRNSDGHYAECLQARIPSSKQVYLPEKFVRYNALSLEIF